MSKTPEGIVKDKVKELLKEFEVYYFMPVQNGYGACGLDFHCCVEGRAVYIETKAPGKKLTPRQENTVRQIQASGGLVFVVSTDEHIVILRNALNLMLLTAQPEQKQV